MAAPVKRYTLNGRVVSLDAAAKKVMVDHEAIPGFMAAMTMNYPVRDSQLLGHLSKGQQITATVVRTGDEYGSKALGRAHNEESGWPLSDLVETLRCYELTRSACQLGSRLDDSLCVCVDRDALALDRNRSTYERVSLLATRRTCDPLPCGTLRLQPGGAPHTLTWRRHRLRSGAVPYRRWLLRTQLRRSGRASSRRPSSSGR